ncbi:MAG: hypothetical protein ACF8PN_10875 [Phycisphaerales bacterium]
MRVSRFIVPGVVVALLLLTAPNAVAQTDPCADSAQLVLQSDLLEARADRWENTAKANTFDDPETRRRILRLIAEQYEEDVELAEAQYQARLDLCELTGEGRYDPDIDPDNFLSPAEIAANPNPFWPLVPGTVYLYRGETDEGVEHNVVHVTNDTREIMGIECVVVHDVVFLNGEKIEDTGDWYSQDKDGNVWYFGELTFEYEDGEIIGIEGSWETGVDGAKPGIVMQANPVVGQAYRQEFDLGNVEDAAQVLSLDESVSVPYGDFEDCLMTGEFTPIEPEVYENKFYAKGIGFLVEVKPKTGERHELIDIQFR